MSFKSLLYCPDEKSARSVTQVLSELDFTVEYATEAFAAVKRLTDEHFDALVVDCQNEEDASVLFKAARNSADNHSSLSVAVVDGQAGVAKAFRIGANLVLTKPINIEQSKSTLRVARGLLRKNQPKAGAPATSVASGTPQQATSSYSTPSTPVFNQPRPAQPSLTPAPQMSSVPLEPAAPFSALEVEKEAAPLTEAADAAVLDSLPQMNGIRPAESSAPPTIAPTPIAASTSGPSGAATGVAPALEKKLITSRPAGASPLVTNEPIVSNAKPYEPPVEVEPIPAPTFSSYATEEKSGGGKFLKVAVVLVVLGAGGYFGWPKLKTTTFFSKVVQRISSSHTAAQTSTVASSQPATQQNAGTPATGTDGGFATPSTAPSSTTASASEYAGPSNSHSAHQNEGPIETIEAQSTPAAEQPSEITVTPEPQPIVVKQGTSPKRASAPASPIAAPSINVADTGNPASASELAGLVPTTAMLPKPAPGTIRVSQGVSQGMLLKKVAPVYPSIARQMGKEGTVELLATIDKDGEVSKVKVLHGDMMLARAAVDAVKEWVYRPYLLNGRPVEIETQITVVFRAPQ